MRKDNAILSPLIPYAKGIKISLPIKLGLAFVAGLLAWAVGPFGLLDKDVVSEIPAWILPGIVFGALLLVPHSSWVSPGHAVAALGIGVFSWVAAFAVGGFGLWIFGWLSVVAAGSISGMILGLLVPRLIQPRQPLRCFLVLSFAGFLGSIPFAMWFITLNLNEPVFAWQLRSIPSYIFWNLIIAIALHLSATRDA
jgi:hypothetical protein